MIAESEFFLLCWNEWRTVLAGLTGPPLLSHARPAVFRRGKSGRIAQLVEQLTLNQRVQGSSPCAPTKT